MESTQVNEASVLIKQMTLFATQNRKLALIIGINKYPRNSKLLYCVNDADDVATKLESINFKVLKGIDCDFEKFQELINQFVQSIESNDLVLFYFAGHGNEFENKNYLLPANYIFDHSTDERKYIQKNSINVQNILHKIENKNPDSIIMILDCCRIYVQTRAMIGQAGGLACIKGPPESLIAFSCGFNQGALDDTRNNRNGIFTEHLLKYLTTDQDIITILEMVGKDIKEHGFPLPWRTTCLTKKVYLIEQTMQIQQYTKNGVKVAGSNKQGAGLDQLAYPSSLCVDDDRTIYIAEWNNHRVVAWKSGATSGQVVAGGNGQGNEMTQLNSPTDVIIDKNKTSLIICDHGNKRVVRWPLHGDKIGEILVSNIVCNGLAMDNQGLLYVSDTAQSYVKRWKIGEPSGTIVAGGNGRGSYLNKLNDPYYLFVDEYYSIYISDNKNHRVIKWNVNAKQGTVVAGGQGEGNHLTQLSDPLGVVVDRCGAVYVADAGNSRIVRWSKGDTQGNIIIGGNGEGQQGNQLNRPNGLSFDRRDSLYIVEENNHRVQRFDINEPSFT